MKNTEIPLTLTLSEARTLFYMLERIGGDYFESPRGRLAGIYRKLSEAGITPTEYGTDGLLDDDSPFEAVNGRFRSANDLYTRTFDKIDERLARYLKGGDE